MLPKSLSPESISRIDFETYNRLFMQKPLNLIIQLTFEEFRMVVYTVKPKSQLLVKDYFFSIGLAQNEKYRVNFSVDIKNIVYLLRGH